MIIFILVFNSSAGLFSQAYSIEVTIPELAGDSILLGNHMNQNMYPRDTVILDHRGKGVFEGKEPLPGGMYLVFLPNRKYFDILIDKDQEFGLEVDTADFAGSMKVSGSKINEAFYEYQKYLKFRRQSIEDLRNKLEESTDKRDSMKITDEIKTINEEVKSHTLSMIDAHRGDFFGTFLRALQDIEVPEPPRDEEGNITDSAFQYRYYRKHYFDNFDPGDPRLLRTPFYESKLMEYLDMVIPQVPDSIIQEVDWLIGKSRNDPQLFRYMLITLFNHYARSQIMGMDKVYVHIAENYYIPEATWSSPDFIEKLKERVEKTKPILIGKKAQDIELVQVPDEHFIAAADDPELKKNPYVGNFFNLHEVNADYIILYFWETDCGHCKTYTPKLHEIYERLRDKGLKIVAVHMLGGEEGKVKWVDFVNEHKLYGWINCWNPYDFTYKIRYDIISTPTLFILDENKEIVAKRIDPEQAEKIIDAFIKKKS